MRDFIASLAQVLVERLAGGACTHRLLDTREWCSNGRGLWFRVSRITQRNSGRNVHPCLASLEVGLASGYDSSPSLTGHNRPWPVIVQVSS